jgi:hypothetical protein
MRVGFTGTRAGCTPPQRAALFAELARLRAQGAEWLHHGCAAGADREAHEEWVNLGGRVHLHPSDDPEQLRWRAAQITGKVVPGTRTDWLVVGANPGPPLWRNGIIVSRSDVLVACPREAQEVTRSGTWATVRAARARGLEHVLVLPSGMTCWVDEARRLVPQGRLAL